MSTVHASDVPMTAEERVNQRNAVLAGFLGWTLDAFDFFLLTFVIPDIAKEFSVQVADVAEALGLWGRRVEQPDDLEDAVKAWLAAPGPALLDVVTDRYELVMPPKIELSQMFGMALYSAKGVLSGRGGDVASLVKNALST